MILLQTAKDMESQALRTSQTTFSPNPSASSLFSSCPTRKQRILLFLDEDLIRKPSEHHLDLYCLQFLYRAVTSTKKQAELKSYWRSHARTSLHCILAQTSLAIAEHIVKECKVPSRNNVSLDVRLFIFFIQCAMVKIRCSIRLMVIPQ